MLPLYEDVKDNLEIELQESCHVPPHLHKSIECICVTEGTLELGIGQELYHMEQNDFAIVFPDLIHHYQVFDSGRCQSVYLLASPSLAGASFASDLQQFCPENPVIPSQKVHPDIRYALESLRKNPPAAAKTVLHQAFLQIILARSLPLYKLVEKASVGSNDIIYQTVSYIAAHFREPVTLTGMAHDLGFSPYALSRVFSGTFHKNFNGYLNETRLDYACNLLLHTDQTITEVLGNAGFDSQRTFNRVFQEQFHMTPREYRNAYREQIEK